MLRCSDRAVFWFLTALMMVLVVGCIDKGLDPEAVPVVTTSIVTDITPTAAQCGGEITSDGGTIVVARGICWSTNAIPTVIDDRTKDGTGAGSFTSNITGLNAGIAYYARAYATNSAGTGYGAIRSFTTGAMDIDGNSYRTVKIGNQVWMMENLKVTHYRNGDPIPHVIDSGTWAGLTTGGYSDYDNDLNNVATYGRLYNWHAVNDSRNVAPEGWHVPSDDEWKQLEMYLGMSQAEADDTGARGTDEGGKLKESGTIHWSSPNTGATNHNGFTALPGGNRGSVGFIGMGDEVGFWSSTETNSYDAWNRFLFFDYSEIARFGWAKHVGFSVRCVRD